MSRVLLAAIALLGVPSLRAAPPILEALFPAGGQAGSTFTLAANGKLEADAHLWIDCPGVYFVPNGKKREWQVTILPDAPPGLHLVRAWNREGASEPRWFSIGALPETSEAEPNDEFGKAQELDKLPVCINARLDKGGDVDGYTVKLTAGQTLTALVEAYALGSPVDVMAHVLNDKGVRVLTVSDGRNLDPLITFKAAAAGDYTVQLAGFAHPPSADERFTGGATAVYRLHLSTGPVVGELFPPVSSDSKTKQPGEIVAVAVPKALQPFQAVTSDKPALTEKEPNNESAQAMPIKAGDTVGARISDKDPQDRYALTAKKGDRFSLRVFARRLGSDLDAVLEVSSAEGKSLLTQDDTGDKSSDPEADWAAPADGTYQIAVKDRFSHGGESFFYVLQVRPAAPDYKPTLAEGKPVTLEPGKNVSLKANVKVVGDFKDPLVCRVAGLPPGVHAAEVPVPAKGGDVEIKLEAAAEAAEFQGPIHVTIWTKDGHVKTASYPLRGENLRGTSLLDQAEALWLTVKGK